MKAVWWVTCALVLPGLIPWIRCFFKRIVMAVKLRDAAKKNGWTFRPARPLWFLAPNGGTEADCFFEGQAGRGRRVYSVKLWASLFRMQNAYFIGEDPQTVRYKRIVPLAGRFGGKYGWELNEIAEGTGGGISMVTESREKKRLPVDYRTGAENGEDVFPVLLFCPAPLNVAEARVVPLTHSTMERLPMFTKPADTTLAVRRLFDGDLLHEREYVFGTEAFCSELRHPHIGCYRILYVSRRLSAILAMTSELVGLPRLFWIV